ncbi:MAG: Lsm family RNA-binding protein [Candidatus Thorarchaeota archaeon]|jgi:small nuclear ribonucleoprotein (snRNP)-like protein
MSDVAAMRIFNREMAAVVGASVNVTLTNGKSYSGTLKGVDQNTLSIILSDVVSEGEGAIPKIFIYGSSIMSFSVAEREISLEGLAKELQKQFPPGGVNYYPDTQVIVVMNKIRITPDGVDGAGPLYERVKDVADDWLKEHGLD